MIKTLTAGLMALAISLTATLQAQAAEKQVADEKPAKSDKAKADKATAGDGAIDIKPATA